MKYHPDYELFEELGRGQSSVVYRAHDLALGRDVAIKEFVEDQQVQDPGRIRQFLQEAQFLAQFEHENILRIYSVDAQRAWIIMELMKANLASQIVQGGLAPELIRSILRQALRGLDFLHRNNKIHAAVRPSNLLINDEGFVKLSDFEETAEQGELRIPAQSKKYLAPELMQPHAGPITPALDLYSLGFTALELLAGPNFGSFFPGTDEAAIDPDLAWMRWHNSSESLPPVRDLIVNVPDDIADLIDAMVNKSVDARPKSAKAALHRLEERAIERIQIVAQGQRMKSTINAPVARVRTISEQVASLPVSSSPELSSSSASGSASSKRDAERSNPMVAWFNSISRKSLLTVTAILIVLSVTVGGAAALVSNLQKVSSQIPNGSEEADVAREPQAETKTETITIFVEPEEATVYVDGDLLETDSGLLELEIQEETGIQFKAELEGYRSIRESISWEQFLANNFIMRFVLEENEEEPRMQMEENEEQETRWQLPDSLIAVRDSRIDAETGLPDRAYSNVLPSFARMEFILIPPGNYRVGAAVQHRFPWELPQSDFQTTEPFYMAVHETSIFQYSFFAETEGGKGAGDGWKQAAEQWSPGVDPVEQSSTLPVSNIAARQAAAFCNWMGGRLPFEQEWEAAAGGTARGGVDRDNTPIGRQHLFQGQVGIPISVNDSGFVATNGFFHAIGNVSEWCRVNPEQSTGSSEIWVVKGCSFVTPVGKYTRPAWRSLKHENGSGNFEIGFRVLIPVAAKNAAKNSED